MKTQGQVGSMEVLQPFTNGKGSHGNQVYTVQWWYCPPRTQRGRDIETRAFGCSTPQLSVTIAVE